MDIFQRDKGILFYGEIDGRIAMDRSTSIYSFITFVD